MEAADAWKELADVRAETIGAQRQTILHLQEEAAKGAVALRLLGHLLVLDKDLPLSELSLTRLEFRCRVVKEARTLLQWESE